MKANQTQNATQFASQTRALQSDVLAFFDKSEGQNQKLMSIKTFMFVTLTNFAANALHSTNAGALGRQANLSTGARGF